MWITSCLKCFLFLILMINVECAKILGLFAFPGTSHSMMYKAIMRELASRGHEITMVSNFPQEEKIANYTDIVIEPIFDFWTSVREKLDTPNIFQMNDMSYRSTLAMMYTIGYTTTEHALKHPKVQELINSNDKHFDLIIAEQFHQEPFLMFAHKYKVPVITVGTFGFGQYMSPLMGSFSPWSHVPHEFVPYDDKMSFFERVNNVATTIYEAVQRKVVYMPKLQIMAEQYFANLSSPLPQLTDLERNISAILLNSHVPLTTPRPSVLGLIQVGGLHITEKPKVLPANIQKFLDGAEHGAIFFSLGTNLRSADMPPDKLSVFLDVFASLKQRILWKWEDDKVPNLPPNVMIMKWLPQSDILAHKNLKVFITHGGLLSTQEGVFRAVPMLGIPVYCDQHLNMNKANNAGYAISIRFTNITKVSLSWSLNELIYNPSYLKNIKEISRIFRDRPLRALDETMYWIEYIIRYKGAPHIRSSALDMSWFSYFLVDVFGFFIVCAAGISWLFYKLFVMMIGQKNVIPSHKTKTN